MATLKTRWLLSIFLVNLQNCVAPGGLLGFQSPPAPPSEPECHIPCDENTCLVDIHCTWETRQASQVPSNYSLHWEPVNSREGHVISGTSSNGLICRERFSNLGELRVWVQAENQYGSTKSQKVVFSVAKIIKPPPPNITLGYHDPPEIHWISACNQLELSLGQCDVRHRAAADQAWLEDSGFHSSYTFESLQPCVAYEFQVHCICATGLWSNWSAIQIQGPETTPVGQLDVWRDCGIFPKNSDCVLTWKSLPEAQACGHILGYEVRLTYNNGTAVLVNVSRAEPRGQLVSDRVLYNFTYSLKDVSSVSVSAYNAHGATVPSYITMPVPGKEKNDQAFHLNMTEENLTVSWDLTSQLSDNLTEYVVQYKKAGSPPGKEFDWVKVNKSHTTMFFKGKFKNYTPYQVSLFTVSHSNEVLRLSSAIGYSLQRTPSRVPLFKVASIDATHVTLFWEAVPLSKQDGVILHYQLGVDGQKVYNVSVSPQHENKTFQLLDLSPGKDYDVWIRAVTIAGPGENVTIGFKTKDEQHFAYWPALLIITFCLLGIGVLILVCVWRTGENKTSLLGRLCFCDKVPDPRNSQIFKEIKQQINDPMAWICIPTYEPHPKISLLEVVEIPPWTSSSSLQKTSDADGLTRQMVGDGSSQIDHQIDQREDAVIGERHKTDHKYGREAYSKMVDSDDEEDRGECWSSSEEEQCTSGYEKHFMPTALEILEVL